ncbi:MAG: nodulation protein NfeD [Armatimonadota bacterium]
MQKYLLAAIVTIALFFSNIIITSADKKDIIAPVYILTIKGQIDPAMAGYVTGGIQKAENEGAQAVLILMDTPGGLMTSMDEIIQSFFAAKVPIIVFVYPNGARAASAGAFITIAADIAAMVPVSNIGSASPIQISPSGDEQKTDDTMKRKVESDAVEKAKSIAEKRGRNEKWAEKAVTEAANLRATDALKQNVIDLIANDVEDLLKKIDGREVKLVSTEKTVVLKTANAPTKEVPIGIVDRFLHYLSNPMVAMFLFMAAMYGIIYELANPGAIFPGLVGAIALILLLYSFSVIPINAAGIVFVVFAIVLFIAEVLTPGTGLLAAGGTLSLFFGLMMLFRSVEGFMVPWSMIVVVTLVTAAFFIFLVSMGIKALRKPYVSSKEAVVNHIGKAKTDLKPIGKVFIDGALWNAESESGDIEAGESVEVVRMEGLKLFVKKAE